MKVNVGKGKQAEGASTTALCRWIGGRREYWTGGGWGAAPVWAPVWRELRRGEYLVTPGGGADVWSDDVWRADQAAIGAARDLESARATGDAGLVARCAERLERALQDATWASR